MSEEDARKTARTVEGDDPPKEDTAPQPPIDDAKASDNESGDDTKETTYRDHKDRLFKFLFGKDENREFTRSLYNALEGAHVTDAADFTFIDLESPIYKRYIRNDVSFFIGKKLRIWEHQSTVSGNMPLRMLMYATSHYYSHLKRNKINLFTSKLQEIPEPGLWCLYNGIDERPPQWEETLSLAYAPEEERKAGSVRSADVETTVHMVNINYGKNDDLMEKCEPLKEYAWLVKEIRKRRKDGKSMDEAVDGALKEMPKEFVIKPIIDASKGAVRDMCIEDFTQEEELELMREAIVEDTTEKVRKETTEENWDQFREITALICSGMSSAKEIAERFAVPEELIESCATMMRAKLPLYDA